MMLSSSSRKYDVFVSHAREDAPTIAIPLREMLTKQGITAFVAEEDISPGDIAVAERTSAMVNAHVAVIVLSPEFVAEKCPMNELLFFLHRRKMAQAKGKSLPVIIPVFYRLTVANMCNEPDLERKTADGKSLYGVTRFLERRDNGEAEADVKNIQGALRTVQYIMGVENKHSASNEMSSMPSRQLLLNDICETVSQAAAAHLMRITRTEEVAITSDGTEPFRRHFHDEPSRRVVLDFANVDANGMPLTHEGRIKRRILNYDSGSDQVIASLGIGGVGKSTILKALVKDKDLQERFCDGIHFISLGMDATIRTLVQELSRVLRDSGTMPLTTVEPGTSKPATESNSDVAIRETTLKALIRFHGKRCLFLIDDVWTKALGVELFSHLVKLGYAGQQSSVVFTTRELEIASVANQESVFRVTPSETQGNRSRDILFLHAGIKKAKSSDNLSIEGILEICDGLPVSLAAAGKGVKMMAIDMATHDGNVWTEYLKIIHTCREQLLHENVREYGNLYVTLRASIALLEGREGEKLGFDTPAGFAEMHRRLCVLRKQAKAPVSMLRYLWELKSESEARVVGMRFVEVGLAESAFKKVDGGFVWHLSVHDSIHDFAGCEAKRRGGVAHAHKVLLDSYRRYAPHRFDPGKTGQGPWTAFWLWAKYDERGFEHIKQNLDYHLSKAGLFEDAEEVLGFQERLYSHGLGAADDALCFDIFPNLTGE